MGLTVSMIIEEVFELKKKKVLMLGLDFAGKATILNILKKKEIIFGSPIVGFNIQTIEYKDLELTSWDIVRDRIIRLVSRHFYKTAQGLVLVVDCSDRERIQEVRDELQELLREEELKDVPLLVLSNKKDLTGMSLREVGEKLQLDTLGERVWHIQATCAITGDGLFEGFEWISKNYVQRSKLLSCLRRKR